MSITSGIGLVSGMDTGTLIQQLLAIEARPKASIQKRLLQLKTQQAAYLDLNSKLSALKSAASAFRTTKLFNSAKATSSDEGVLTATASNGAAMGSYNFLVDQLVSSQQMLSKGFASKTSPVNATKFSVETAQARLDRDTALADLHGGAGIERGKIIITDVDGKSATIDLSKAATVTDVLDAINNAEGVNMTAKVEGGKFVLTNDDGKTFTVKSAAGSTTAASLGIEQLALTSGATLTGQAVYKLSDAFSIKSINDGNGLSVNSVVGVGNYDFTLRVVENGETTDININLGNIYNSEGKVLEAAPQDIGGVIKRINDTLATAGFDDVNAAVNAEGNGLSITTGAGRTLRITENTISGTGKTATELGFQVDTDVAGGVMNGTRILAGMNDTLAKNLNGGVGIAGGGSVSITDRTGMIHTVSFDAGSSITEILAQFEADSGGVIKATLNAKGTGLEITDTSAGTGNLIIGGASAAALGIETTGVAASSFTGSNLQHKYVSDATTLASLNNGKGIGNGTMLVTDTTGKTEKVTIGDSIVTVSDFLKFFNSRGLSVKARINANGDGIEIYEDAVTPGSVKLKITDESGKVAANLNIAGEAKDVGADNKIIGSYEETVEFSPTDTLEQIAEKFNLAGLGATAAVVQDGTGSTPFRLSFTAALTGQAGRFILDTGSLDLGMATLDKGQNAKVFYGSSDPAKALLVTSSTNTLDKLVPGVSIDLKSTSEDPVKLTVAKDNEKLETAVGTFVTTFNTLIDRIDALSKYDQPTNTKGALLGDSAASQLRRSMTDMIQGKGLNLSSAYDSLAEVGVSIGKSGDLEFNAEKFREAYAKDPQGVEELFTAYEFTSNTSKNLGNGIVVNDPTAKPTFTKLGVLGRLEQLADTYVNSVDGVLTLRGRTLDGQIDIQNKRNTALDAKLESKRGILEAQFLAMEKTIAQLQRQQNSLMGLSQLG